MYYIQLQWFMQSCVRVGLGANVAWTPAILTEVFVVFLNLSTRIQGQYLNLATTASLCVLPNPTIRRRIMKLLAGSWNNQWRESNIASKAEIIGIDTILFIFHRLKEVRVIVKLSLRLDKHDTMMM